MEVQNVVWRPNGRQLVVTRVTRNGEIGAPRFYLVDDDGTDLRPIPVSPLAVDAPDGPSLSPDGTMLAYAAWEPVPGAGTLDGRSGRIHVIDIDAGNDRRLDLDGSDGRSDMDPRFSPDGTKLLIVRGTPAGETFQHVIVPVEGAGPTIAIGHAHTGQADAMFSPDGTTVLATYSDDSTTWLLGVDGRTEQPLPGSGFDGQAWQRLAP